MSAINVNNVWTNILDDQTGESVNFEEVTTWWDGSPMDDSKADGEVYRKLPSSVGGWYVRRVYDNFGQLFLEKDTMAEMRALSSTEILLIQMGRYKGVKLNGYYEKGDTPAPIEYFISETLESDDGGSVIEVGGIKFEHIFNSEIHSSYFGFTSYNSLTPLQVNSVLQTVFNKAKEYLVSSVIIAEGDYIIDNESADSALRYEADNTSLYWNCILRLADNNSSLDNLTGARIIAYAANNIKVYNQRLDGNAENQAPRPQIGTQFTFVSYGQNNLGFIGGWVINSVQCHIQASSDNMSFKNVLFEDAGEHALYLTLAPDATPSQNTYFENVIIRGWGLRRDNGVALSIRSWRRGVYNNCIFDPGDKPKPGTLGIITIVYNYRGATLGEKEEFSHTFNDCRFLGGDNIVNGIFCRVDNESTDGTTTEYHVEKGRGVYINGGDMEVPRTMGVVEARNVRFHNKKDNPFDMNFVPSRSINCSFKHILRIRPSGPEKCIFENCEFEDTDDGVVSAGILFDFSQGILDTGRWIFKGNFFKNFKNSESIGIIRNTTKPNVEIIIDGNYFEDCNTARLVSVGTNSNISILNNVDIGNTGIRLNLGTSLIPKLISNNSFIRTTGSTLERPSGGNLYLGLCYFDTTLGHTIWHNGTNWVDATGTTV